MIEFSLSEEFSMSPESFCDEIFDVSKWSDFKGYGPIPGIRSVERKNYSESRIGTRFEIINTDDSNHVETVTDYQHGKLITLYYDGFSKPLDGLASHFTETFQFEKHGSTTHVKRTFQLFPKNFIGKIMLSITTIFLKRAVKKHFEKLVELDAN